jgi:hypothetical protein
MKVRLSQAEGIEIEGHIDGDKRKIFVPIFGEHNIINLNTH